MPNIVLNYLDGRIHDFTEIPQRQIDLARLYARLILFDRIASVNPAKVASAFSIGEPRAFLDTPKGHLQELQDAGIYKSFSWPYYGDFANGVSRFLESMSKNWSDDDWLVDPSFVAPESPRSNKYLALRVELIDGLVCPSPSFHIDDILSFKDRRSAERLAFWHEIYEVTQSVDFDDRKCRISVERRRLEQKIADFNQVSHESFRGGHRFKASIGLQLNLATISSILSAVGDGGLMPVVIAGAGLVGIGLDYATQAREPNQGVRAVSYIADAMGRFNARA